MKVKKLLRGMLSYVPILKSIIPSIGTGGTDNSKYCYNVYRRHKEVLLANGCNFPITSIGEIGPGDSIGVGISAILDGASFYNGFDAIAHANSGVNIQIFNELIALFENDKIYIPEKLKSDILLSLADFNNIDSIISYYAPWWEKHKDIDNSLDVVISTAVMEHVSSLKGSYKKIFEWVKPGGFCSHIIDYGAHEFSNNWFEHYYYNDVLWNILLHGRKYSINRMPHSYQIQCMNDAGFIIKQALITKDERIIDIHRISSKIVNYFEDQDLSIRSSHIIAQKPF